MPNQYRKRYDADAIQHRPNVELNTDNPLADGLDPDRTLADYYAAISALDDQLGRILDTLRDTGIEKNTIVVFTSDHGDMLWSHGRMKKQQPWEESIRVPFIVRWPDAVPAGSVSEMLISTVDHVPTLLGMIGIEHRLPVAGQDLSGLLRGQSTPRPESVFLMDIVPVDEGRRQGIPEWRGVRTARHTYVERLGGTPWLLYDNIEDLYQTTNLVDAPEQASTQRTLAGELRRWLAYAGDDFAAGPEHIRRKLLKNEWSAREQYMARLEPERPATRSTPVR